MSNLQVKKGHLLSKVHIPSSKSYANRALILAAINPEEQTLLNLPSSTDVTILVEALKKTGLIFREKKNALTLVNSFPACEKRGGATLHVGEGGTTARFLAGMLLLGKARYELVLGERLKDRPWDEFISFVVKHGGHAELMANRLILQGPLELPEIVEVDCSRTTQFASAFQLAFSFLRLKVNPLNMTSSQSYWAMTEKLIHELRATPRYTIPLDWSSASYPLAFGALNQAIDFPGLIPDPFQADSKFFDILQSSAAVETYPGGLSVHPLKIKKELQFDVRDCLDLVPTLGYFLAHIPGKHALTGIENLVYKESDRLGEVIKLLSTFKRKAWTEGNTLYIEGNEEIVREVPPLKLPDDHRMVMTATLFLLHHQGGELGPVEAVSKSYPDFFKLLAV